MIHFKNIHVLVLMMFAFISCTEVYTPEVNSSTDALIVEGLITDGAGPFNIRLSKAMPFSVDSVSNSRPVLNAELTITNNENQIFKLINTGTGNYTTPSTFRAEIGNSYKLHIFAADGNIYESNPEELLRPLTYDSIFGLHTIKKYLDVNKDLRTADGVDIRVDLFNSVSKANSAPLCRFTSKSTIQYFYPLYIPGIIDYHWVYFGWAIYSLDENNNITDERSLVGNPSIKNHSLGFMPFGMSNYGYHAPTDTYVTYYLRFNQYTITHDSYNFYKEANDQLAANGKIFDPITSQLYGNITCVTDRSKIVLGLFEVSSVTKFAIATSGTIDANKVLLRMAPYIEDIPNSGESYYKVWDGSPIAAPKTDPDYFVIPYPSWWYHN